MSANPGRVAAAQALMAVELGSNLEDILPELAPQEGRDRGLAWFTAFGVLRCRGRIDAALHPHLRTPLGGLDSAVRAALRLGAFEILFARTQKHAAVHQAVEVAKAIGAKRAQGLVNAILRRVRPDAPASPADQVDAPSWLYGRWLARYGAPAAQAWFAQASTPPPLYVVGEFDGEPTDVDGVFRVVDAEGRIEEMDGFATGRFWVQDKASVKVADLVGDVQGKRVLDACAAPGGKAFRLASRGAKVLAVDRSPERLQRVVEGAQRLELDLEARVHDWARGQLGETFDAVLVDAPCTALGTLRRNPEAKWRRQLVDVLSMPATQGPILAAASASVQPGGVLVYAVCSVEPEEGAGVVDAFLAAHPQFSLDRALTTAPDAVDEDGFFAARMIRDRPESRRVD